MAAIRTARDVGAAVRAAREEQGLTQATLATMTGVSRRWLIAIEQGDHQRAELDRVLRVLQALSLDLSITTPGRPRASPPPSVPATVLDLDAHVAGFREGS